MFGSAQASADIHTLIAKTFSARFGFAPMMMLVRAAELAAAVGGNPFTAPDPARLHLGFMETLPGQAALAALAARPRTSEEYVVRGALFYLFTPDGLGRSKFAAAVEKTLKTPVTFRNWRSVLALAEMADR